jgi:hypothetical protein
MAKSKLAELVAQTAEWKRESEVDLLNVDSTVLPGRTAMKNAALQKYQETFTVLRSVVGLHAGGIFVSGPGAKSFAEQAAESGPAIVLDASEMYSKVAAAWYPTVRVDKVFALDCIMAFLGGVQSVLPPLGIRELARPEFGSFFGRSVESMDDAIAVTRDILRATVGDDLNGIYLNHRLAEEVVAAEWDLATIPVVYLNYVPEELVGESSLFFGLNSGHNIPLVSSDQPTKAEFVEVFKKIRSFFRTSKQAAAPTNDSPNDSATNDEK